MNTEQELRPCAHCGGKAVQLREGDQWLEHYHHYFIRCTVCHAQSAKFHANVDDSHGAVQKAIAAWNRRSSDEQAEVVGWQWRYVGGVTPYVQLFGTEWRTPLEYAERADLDGSDDFDTRNLYACPPAVAAGGVTEALITALATELVRIDLATMLPDRDDIPVSRELQAAIDATKAKIRQAFAGMKPVPGEEWQPIETAPKDGTYVDLFGARNGRQMRFPSAKWAEIHMMGTGDPTGEYRWFFPDWDIYGEFEFSHWRNVPTPPSRGEGV